MAPRLPRSAARISPGVSTMRSVIPLLYGVGRLVLARVGKCFEEPLDLAPSDDGDVGWMSGMSAGTAQARTNRASTFKGTHGTANGPGVTAVLPPITAEAVEE